VSRVACADPRWLVSYAFGETPIPSSPGVDYWAVALFVLVLVQLVLHQHHRDSYFSARTRNDDASPSALYLDQFR